MDWQIVAVYIVGAALAARIIYKIVVSFLRKDKSSLCSSCPSASQCSLKQTAVQSSCSCGCSSAKTASGTVRCQEVRK